MHLAHAVVLAENPPSQALGRRSSLLQPGAVVLLGKRELSLQRSGVEDRPKGPLEEALSLFGRDHRLSAEIYDVQKVARQLPFAVVRIAFDQRGDLPVQAGASAQLGHQNIAIGTGHQERRKQLTPASVSRRGRA